MTRSYCFPEDKLTQMLVRRSESSGSRHCPEFEPVDGVNLVIRPRDADNASNLLAAASAFAANRFFHSAGLGPECRDPNVLLWRLLNHIRRQAGFLDPVPMEADAMRETLPNWLARAAAAEPFVVVIEDAHELTLDGLTADIDWLPDWLPPGIAVLLSAPPGPAAEQFRERAGQVLNLTAKTRSSDQRTLAPELLESNESRHWLELLWASRAGLPRVAMETLLATRIPELNADTPGLLVDDDHVALASSLARDAVARRWLGDHGDRQKIHMRLGDHFSGQAHAEQLELASWHWSASGRMDRLAETLTQTAMLEGMAQPGHAFEALHRWRTLGDHDAMHGSLEAAVKRPAQSSDAILGAVRILSLMTSKEPPLEWLHTAAERAVSESSPHAQIRALQQLATHSETDAAAAHRFLDQALAAAQALPEAEPSILASLHHRKACAFESAGQAGEAVREYARAVELIEESAGGDSSSLIAWVNNLAAAQKVAGDLRSADQSARRSLRLARSELGGRHPATASCCDQLAGIAYMNGQYDVGEPLYREALEITENAFGPKHPATAACLGNLGSVLDALQRFREAEQCHRRALAILMSIHGETHEDTASCMHNLAVVLESLGNATEAEAFYRRALETWNEIVGEKSPAFATTLLNLAGVLRERGAWGEAEALYRSDIELWRELLGPDHPHTLGALTELARLYVDGGKPEMAEPLLVHLAERTQAHSGKSGTAYLEVAALLAGVQHRFGHSEEARALLRSALAASEGTLNMLSAPVQKLRKLLEQIDDTAPETRH